MTIWLILLLIRFNYLPIDFSGLLKFLLTSGGSDYGSWKWNYIHIILHIKSMRGQPSQKCKSIYAWENILGLMGRTSEKFKTLLLCGK